MRHRFMHEMSACLAAAGIATLRYQFPYMEAGSRRPDARPILLATVRAAVNAARGAAPDLPLLAGGKSMGGRMTSLAAAEAPLPGVHGLVFFGFPPSRGPAVDRACGASGADPSRNAVPPGRTRQARATGPAAADLRRARRAPPCTWCRPRITACMSSAARGAAMPMCSSTSPTRLPNGPPRSPSATACEFVFRPRCIPRSRRGHIDPGGPEFLDCFGLCAS